MSVKIRVKKNKKKYTAEYFNDKHLPDGVYLSKSDQRATVFHLSSPKDDTPAEIDAPGWILTDSAGNRHFCNPETFESYTPDTTTPKK